MREGRRIHAEKKGNKIVVTAIHEIGEEVFTDSMVLNLSQAINLKSKLNDYINDMWQISKMGLQQSMFFGGGSCQSEGYCTD